MTVASSSEAGDAEPERRTASTEARGDLRPVGVPADAYWSDEDEVWVVAPLDDAGSEHGLVRQYRRDGSLAAEIEHEHGVPHGSIRKYHESGEVARMGRCHYGRMDGVHTFYRTALPTSERFPAGLASSVARIAMTFARGRIMGWRCYDAAGRSVREDGSLA